MVVGLLGNESSDSNRFTLVTPKPENGVRLQATLGNQNPTGLPMGAVRSVSPSYWADIPGQFKVFIDRCTPWCNTHEPHAKISSGKKGYVIALRTGPGMRECERIIASIEHFYGHMEIECCDSLGLCSVEYKEDLDCRKEEIIEFCNQIE